MTLPGIDTSPNAPQTEDFGDMNPRLRRALASTLYPDAHKMTYLLMPSLAAVSMLAMAAFPGHAAPQSADPLATFRWKARVLVVLAPSANDPQLITQRGIFQAMKLQADERDLALLEAIGDEPRATRLRSQFGLDDHSFHAILVGKDGGEKLTADVPLGPEQLLPLIDSMPMRQQEIQSK